MGDTLKALTAEQRASARRYPWYRQWLLAHGRTAEEVDGPTVAAASADHFHGCPTPTGRPFDCQYCQQRAASMSGGSR